MRGWSFGGWFSFGRRQKLGFRSRAPCLDGKGFEEEQEEEEQEKDEEEQECWRVSQGSPGEELCRVS